MRRRSRIWKRDANGNRQAGRQAGRWCKCQRPFFSFFRASTAPVLHQLRPVLSVAVCCCTAAAFVAWLVVRYSGRVPVSCALSVAKQISRRHCGNATTVTRDAVGGAQNPRGSMRVRLQGEAEEKGEKNKPVARGARAGYGIEDTRGREDR